VTLMSEKCNLGNVLIFDMYLVVDITYINFINILSPTEFIQKVIDDINGKFGLNGKFFEGMKIRTHVPIPSFLRTMTIGEE
jgi:hypothetical protein